VVSSYGLLNYGVASIGQGSYLYKQSGKATSDWPTLFSDVLGFPHCCFAS